MGYLCSYRIDLGNHKASEVEVEVGVVKCSRKPDPTSLLPEAVEGPAEEYRRWDAPAAVLHAVLSWRRLVALARRHLGEWTRIREGWISDGQNISTSQAAASSLRSSQIDYEIAGHYTYI